MTRMIRKQVYIAKKQQALLSLLAKTRGVSEAEVIRQAIEHEAIGVRAQTVVAGSTDLEDLVRFALRRRDHDVTGAPLHWCRDDAYSERPERRGA